MDGIFKKSPILFKGEVLKSMALHLKRITEDIESDVLKLTVDKDQLSFIESNLLSLQEAKVMSQWRPVAIYDDSKLIGFAMYGKFSNEGINGRVWLDRLMIDKSYQGKGYGKKSLNLLIEHICKEYNCTELYLSIYEDNVIAKKMYKECGFEFNGELDENGEKVMVLDRTKEQI